MRRFPLQVLKEAACAFAGQVHRNDIRDRASYFAAIAGRCLERYRVKREAERREKEQELQSQRDVEKAQAIQTAQEANPSAWLRDALDYLAVQWIPERKALLFGGAGLGKRHLCDAVESLAEIHGPQFARDVANGVFSKFKIDDPTNIGPKGLDALRGLLDDALSDKLKNQTDCKLSLPPAILRNNGP